MNRYEIRLLWFGHQAERSKSLYFHAKEFNLIQVTEQFLTFFAETNSSAWKCQWRLNKCVSWCYTVFSPLLVHPHNPSFGRNSRQPLLLSFLFQSSRNRFPERYSAVSRYWVNLVCLLLWVVFFYTENALVFSKEIPFPHHLQFSLSEAICFQ